MLVLGRKLNESVFIDTLSGRIEVKVVEIDRNRIKLGFVAPRDVPVFREELLKKPEEATTAAT